MKTRNCKPLSLVIGTCIIGSLSGYVIADAQQNPFAMTELAAGYMVAGYEGVCGEGKCGGKKKAVEEGKCGGDKAVNEAVCGIYKVGSAHQGNTKVKDGVCGGHAPVEMLCGDPR
jgi:uncharacterized low-complexity protein